MRYKGRLELTWTNKGQRLWSTDDGRYDWLDPADPRIAEVRVLHPTGTIGEVNPDRPNLLIRGDAHHALAALNRIPEHADQYAGKARLVYIDPPFNTGQAFQQYDDNLEHSVWLSMLRDRLTQIRPLLAPDGTAWVHLDDVEVHRCRSVMDEVFGAANFVASIIWRSSDNSNNDALAFSTDHNTILVYSRQPGWRSNREQATPERLPHYRNPDNDPRGPYFDGNPLNSPNPRENLRYTLTAPDGSKIPPPPNGWRWSKETLAEKIASGEVRFRDDNSGIKRRTYLADHTGLPPSTLWVDLDVTGHNRQAKYELKTLFPDLPTSDLFKTPKPERLLRRIIALATNPGDLVIDCFAGSGTTASVAHKMGRQWVTVEQSAETVNRFTQPRLTRVVSGDDQGGISTDLGWAGGGGFNVAEVARSIYEVDTDTGEVFMSDDATNGRFAVACAAQLGFPIEPSGPFVGKKGRTRLAALDGVVGAAEIEHLAGVLDNSERMVVVAKAFTGEAQERLAALSRGSRLRHAPTDLVGGRVP